MNIQPKAFISYSHEDREIASRIADALHAVGIDAWFDKYEIIPGDSIITKIFDDGLPGTDVFIIVLSETSIKSKWVRQELEAAIMLKIEGETRIIPLKMGNVEIPVALKPLMWINMDGDFSEKIRQLQNAIFQIRDKPPVGKIPDYVKKQLAPVEGLSRLAASIGMFFLHTGNPDNGSEISMKESALAEALGLTPEETDDGVEELEKFRLLRIENMLGTGPYSHDTVEPTYALFLHMKKYGLDYDPEEDYRKVASAIVAKKQIGGDNLRELTDLSPLRINRAVGYIEAIGLAQVQHELGTGIYDFSYITATGETRLFVENK